MYNPVVGTTVHDRVHKGGRQAGFKSHMSYNTEKGIPGYTGYIPGSCALTIPTKGATIHTGKDVHPDVAQKNLLKLNNTHTTSEARDELATHESEFKPPTKTGGGYWLYQREAREGKPFTASSTYNRELLHGAEDKARETERVRGLRATTAYQEQPRRAASSAMSLTRSLRTGNDVPMGYVTEYGSMVAPDPITGGTAAAGGPRKPRAVPEHRDPVQRRAALPRLNAYNPVGSRYTHDYGAYGSDPLDRTAAVEAGMTANSTTADLSVGTTQRCTHIPGYTGHLPASEHNREAQRQTRTAPPRADAKVQQLLFHNDNFSRSRVPGVRTYKPQAYCNTTSTMPSQGPSIDTQQGWTNHQLGKVPLKAVNNENFIGKGNSGTMSFYTNGGVSVSDDGVANAQTFYMQLRPLEGRSKHAIPSKRTAYGASFPFTEY